MMAQLALQWEASMLATGGEGIFTSAAFSSPEFTAPTCWGQPFRTGTRTGNSLRVHLRSSFPKAPRQLGLCPAQCLRGVPLVDWLPVHTCPEEHFLNTVLLSIRPQFKHVKLILQLNDTCNLKAAPKPMEGKKKRGKKTHLPCKIH